MSEAILGEHLPPKGSRRSAYLVGALTAGAGLLWLLIVLPIYAVRGPESGPRWLAGNDLVIHIGVIALFIGFLVAMVTDRDRTVLNFVFAIGLSALTIWIIAELPRAVGDATGPFEERTIEVVEWTISENGTAKIRTADGETLSGPNGFGVVRPTAMPNGRYDVLLTASGKKVVEATPRR